MEGPQTGAVGPSDTSTPADSPGLEPQQWEEGSSKGRRQSDLQGQVPESGPHKTAQGFLHVRRGVSTLGWKNPADAPNHLALVIMLLP